jgi:glycosyltransferase involved in cell wall biosynthesis
MKILIVEEALKTLHGHWFQYISDIVKGGQEAGHQIEVACHKEACPEILNAFPCRPILNATVFEKEAGRFGKFHALQRVFTHNRSLYRDLNNFFAAGNSYDLVIATTPRLDHLLAYRWLFRRHKKKGFRKLVLLFIELVGEYTLDGSQIRFSSGLLPLKGAMLCFRPLLKTGQFIFITESAGLAWRYEQFCGIKFPLVPHVVSLPPLEPFRPVSTRIAGDHLLFGSFGITRYDKGLDLFQAAIKLLKQERRCPGGRFVLQWISDYQMPDGSWAGKDPALLKDESVQYLPAFSVSEEYYRWLARTDIMVLPYRVNFYRDKLSRVSIDAALAGIPFIYPVGTWMESLAEKYGAGVPFEPENAASLADALSRAAARLPELKAKASARQALARTAFSARTFLQTIIALPGKSFS